MAWAMAGYLPVQSLPRRVRICTLPASSRACIRYPSNLISCSQSGPSGALSTRAASCGLIQAGGGAGLTLRRVEITSVMFAARLTLNPRNDAGNQPTRLAHLDDGYDRAILVQ